MNLLAAAATLKALEVIVAEDAGHLAGAVRTEVHEDDGIAVLHATALAGDHGNHKLIGDIGGIGSVNGLLRIGGVVALAVDKGGVGLFFAVPVVVAVHGIVTAGDGGNGAHAQLVQLFLQIGQEALAGMGIGVAAVHDAVQINPGGAHGLGHIQHAEPVVRMAVDAAGSHQTHEVDGLAGIDGGFHVAHQNGIFHHLAVLDGLGDERELLVHDAARAHIGMTHFGVAHLTVRQTHGHAGGVDGGHGVIPHEGIQMGGVGGRNGIAEGLVRRPAKTVHNAKNNRFFRH